MLDPLRGVSMIEQDQRIYAQADEIDSDPILSGNDEEGDDDDEDVPDSPEGSHDL
jgi:hypothetical protein